MTLRDKVILLTGGTGSFGQEFTRIALREHGPKTIRVFSRGEFLQNEMQRCFNDDPRLRFFIGDVRDKDRLRQAMRGVDIVVHAAALKQVPSCEYNPVEAVKTNIEGAINIIDAATVNEVSKVIAISTDKAVHPANLYGATKQVAERVFIQGNSSSLTPHTRFSCTRYGNIIASRGSVIPLFLEQRQHGFITVTDERMTRFWITMEQGVRFVISCIDRMRGGEIFVPKLPSMKITDIANAVAPGATWKMIGVRPGERIHEILLTREEARHSREYDDYFVIAPETPFCGDIKLEGGRELPADFEYTSNGNHEWISQEQLAGLLEAAQGSSS